MRKSAMAIATGVATVLLVAGCADQSEPAADEHTDHGLGTVHSGSGASPGPATDGAQPHNAADIAFAQHMIPHHSQAVEMVDILLAKQDVDPRVVTLAENIRAAQGPEIEQMQGWLDSWGNPQMPGMGGSMTGMVDPAELETLRAAAGPEASTIFLEQMIGHHEGAIVMARDEIDGGQFAPAVEMARAIVDGQGVEIDEMRSILNTP